MAKDKAHISIDHAKCPPCPTLVCVGVCPEGVLEPGENQKPVAADETFCTECEICANLCPAKAITVKRNKPSK